MTSKLLSRAKLLLGCLLFTIGSLLPVPAFAVATGTPNASQTPADTASPSHTTLPPYSGDVAPRRTRTRTDRLISTIAPIAMVLVLAAGLYIYWLIRKGL